jgi:Kdo2-lipid IVA lauroyltransferase/acyltransferase
MKRRRKKHRNISDGVLYTLIMTLGLLVRSMSRNSSTAIANLIGDFIYNIPKTRRHLVEKNLALTFPEKNGSEIRTIARQVYRNQAENVIEVLRLSKIKTAEDAARLLDLDGSTILANIMERKKGVVMVSAHFGNWELLALCAGLLMAPLTIVVKPLKNAEIDRQINHWRSMRGNRVVYDWLALREGLRTLDNGGILSLLGDQSDPHGSFFMEFLGRRTSVFLGPAFLALKAGVPLFVAMCRRTEDGRYTVDIEEIDSTGLGSTKSDAEELARRYTRVLERAIYRYPEEWFWLHNRWKRSEP